VRASSQVAEGDPVSVMLHEGRLICRVTDRKEKDDRPQV
jgi:hypothetical protein